MIDACSADIILLTEIWFSSTIADREILHCETGYKFYRSDRTGRLGGGVLTAARYSVSSNVIIVDSNLEFFSTT